LAVVIFCACGSSSPSAPWQKVGEHLSFGVTDVWGTSDSDVYLVGGSGPTGSVVAEARHFDGTTWERLTTPPVDADLWWVYGFDGGPVFMAGENGVILRYDPSSTTFMQMTTPSVGTVFGIWGASPDDMWAVGGNGNGANAFAWHLVGGQWTDVTLDPSLSNESLWKVFGRSATDVWMVGTSGIALHFDGSTLGAPMFASNQGESLFTVHADDQKVVAVGGLASPIIVENDGSGWRDVSPKQGNGLVGVCLSPHGEYVVGQAGGIYKNAGADNDWPAIKTGVSSGEPFHAVWVSPTGEVWAVGGNVLFPPMNDGIVVHQGTQVPGGLQ
jgi:hypothetical protein